MPSYSTSTSTVTRMITPLASTGTSTDSGEKDAEEMQGVDYSKLVPYLIKAVQELNKRVEELEQQ